MKQRLLAFFQVDYRFVLTSGILIFLISTTRNYFLVRLPQDSFMKAVYLPDLLGKRPLFLLFIIAIFILHYLPAKQNIFYRKWTWKNLDPSGRLRILVMVIVIIMGWSYGAYEYNFFYDQAHYIDRLFLVLLVIGSWFSPIFVGPMVIVTHVASSQMLYPKIIAYSYTDKLLLFEFLLLFAFYTYLAPLTRSSYSSFIFVALCMVGAFYFYPSQKKIFLSSHALAWILHNDLHSLFVSSYMNGWLSFLSMDTALQIAKVIETIRIPLQALTIMTELTGVIILLFSRRITMLVLFGAICLHFGIVMSSGVFFWKWVVLDVVLIWYLWRSRDDKLIQQIYRPLYGIAAIFIIIFANLFGAISLGWWDGAVNNYFDFEVIDTQGDSYEFPRYYLQPYDLRLAQSRLNFLVDEPLLANTYGTLQSGPSYFRLRNEGLESVDDLKATRGRNSYRENDVEQMEQFILRYFSSHNAHLNDLFIPSVLRPPAHIYTFPRDNAYNDQFPIQTVRVWFTETYYDGSQVTTLQKRVVLEVNIPIEASQNG